MCVFVSFITQQHFCFQLHLKFTVGLIPSGGAPRCLRVSIYLHVLCVYVRRAFADRNWGA